MQSGCSGKLGTSCGCGFEGAKEKGEKWGGGVHRPSRGTPLHCLRTPLYCACSSICPDVLYLRTRMLGLALALQHTPAARRIGRCIRVHNGCMSPRFHQKFVCPNGAPCRVAPHRALWWLFSYSFFVNMMASGLVASSVSSLERRYGFSKTRLGVLLSTSDVVACESPTHPCLLPHTLSPPSPHPRRDNCCKCDLHNDSPLAGKPPPHTSQPRGHRQRSCTCCCCSLSHY